MLDFFDNTVLQGLTYGIAVLGLIVAFRVARYPDHHGGREFPARQFAPYGTCIANGAYWWVSDCRWGRRWERWPGSSGVASLCSWCEQTALWHSDIDGELLYRISSARGAPEHRLG